MNVHVTCDEGFLIKCNECGNKSLVVNDSCPCPLCGSRKTEVDETWYEFGYTTVRKLNFDWFYQPDKKVDVPSHNPLTDHFISESVDVSSATKKEKNENDPAKELFLDGRMMPKPEQEEGSKLAPVISMDMWRHCH